MAAVTVGAFLINPALVELIEDAPGEGTGSILGLASGRVILDTTRTPAQLNTLLFP